MERNRQLSEIFTLLNYVLKQLNFETIIVNVCLEEVALEAQKCFFLHRTFNFQQLT